MGLYLCVFDESSESELEGVEVGGYSDYNLFRSAVTELLENGRAGSVYPTLVLHSDCDGEWSSVECSTLRRELAAR
jgi:hypothetical protein